MSLATESPSIWSTVKSHYEYLFIEIRDPRVDDWMLMSSPWPTAALCLLYYFIIRIAGPQFMKDREPYNTYRIQIVYNLLQTLLSAWIWLKTASFWLTGRYNWLCQPVDYSDSYDALYALDMTWWYFFSKFIDYFDSVFFLLRKKWSHLSTLHVIHHGIMPLTAWSGVKWVGGGHTTFVGFLNMGVHVFMYFYYFMSSFGPSVQPYLWWKRYLTTMQLVQFATFFIHATFPLFIECDFPKYYSYVILFHGAMFFALFLNFYIQAYVNKDKKKIVANGKSSSYTNGSLKKSD